MGWWGDRWHDLEDGAASVMGMKKPSQERAEQQAARGAIQRDAQRRYELRQQSATLAQQAGSGFDPPVINQRTNWDSWDHGKIHTMVNGIQPGELTGHGVDWASLGKDLAIATEGFHRSVTGAISGNWAGQAAAGAISAPQSIVSWGNDFGNAAQATGTQIQAAGTAADQAKATVPQPVDFNWRRTIAGGLTTIGFGGVGGFVDAYEQHQEQQNAKAAAVRVMNTVYTPGYVDADQGTPTFTTPADPTQPPPVQPPPPVPPPMNPPQPPVGPPFQPRQSGTTGNTGSTGHTGGGQQFTPPPAPPAQPLPTDPSQYGGGSVTPPASAGPNPSPTGGWGPTGDGPANQGNAYGPGGFAFGPGVIGAGGSGTDGRGAGAGSRGLGGGTGYRSGEAGGSRPSGPGARSGAGAMAAEEGVLRPGTAAGRPGAGGMAGGPMGAGGRGGKGQEDKERRSAGYLVDEEHGNTIVGDLPLTAPPVIGEG